MPTEDRPIEQIDEGVTRPGMTLAGVGVIVLLLAISVGLVLQGGAYGPSTWLPLLASVAALALVVAIAGPAVLSGRFQKILLFVFILQAALTAASLFWADSRAGAWEETNRTLLYAFAVVLVFAAVRWSGETALKALALSVGALATGVALTVIVAFLIDADPGSLFFSGRLNYPVTYFNALAALLMVGFWLAIGLANGARCTPRPEVEQEASEDGTVDQAAQSRVAWRRSQAKGQGGGRFWRWTQPVLLAVAVVLAEVALLPQSRGALWTFFLVVPFFVILSPNRFRALIDLAIVTVPVVVFWDKLMSPYLALRAETALDAGLHNFLLAVGYSVAIVIGAWALTWIVERWIGPLRRRATVWIAVALAALAIFGAAGGIVYADMRTGGLDNVVSDQWHEMTADKVGATPGATRFTGVGLNGRWRQWKVAIEAFQDYPAIGLGAQNFEAYWYEHRTVAFAVRQPHSQPLQLLSELGLPGALLWLVFIVAALVRAATVRFRARTWGSRVILAALMTAVISWFIHSSADWLWQMAGVSLPAMMLVGGLIAADRSGRVSVVSAVQAPAASPPEAATIAGPDQAAKSTSRRGRSSTKGQGRRLLVPRAVVVLIAIVTLASATLPYLSLRYSGLASGASDLERATAQADLAEALDPTSIQPYVALAGVHLTAASKEASATKRVQQFRLAADAWEGALRIEPASWVCQLGAAEALLAARNAVIADDRQAAKELEQQARIHLQEALRLNPLSPEVVELQKDMDRFSTVDSY